MDSSHESEAIASAKAGDGATPLVVGDAARTLCVLKLAAQVRPDLTCLALP